MALNIKTLTTRTLTAAVFVAVLLTCINYNFLSFTALFFVVSVWGLYEFYQLAEKLGASPYKTLGLLCGAFIYLAAFTENLNPPYNLFTGYFFVIGILLLMGCLIQALFTKDVAPVLNLAYTFMGIIYAVVPFCLLVFATCMQYRPGLLPHDLWTATYSYYNPHVILGVILLIWVSDSGAYLVGSLIGKNKLYERISPGKTWEGSIGATLITIGCSYIISRWYPEIAFKHWIIIAIIVCVFGTIGDLVESMLKRQAGVKDSGRIMPGHGGILDRFDSLLFVSPFVYAYLYLVTSL